MTPSNDDNPVLAAALAWHHAGASVIPVSSDGTKRPAISWKRYQAQRADLDQIHRWFDEPGYGLGVICGAVSADLEMLEFEGRAVREGLLTAARRAAVDHDMEQLWDRVSSGCVDASPSGGIHLHWRVDGPVDGNTKVARRPSTESELADNPAAGVQVLIETRGEGGYVAVAPTPGSCHRSGRGWTRVCGGPSSLPLITPDEREGLLAALSTLDAMPEPPRQSPTPQRPVSRPEGSVGDRPGDQWAAATSWDDILTPQGWTKGGRSGRGWFWTRPGKKRSEGISASTGTGDGADNLYVWSTSTDLPSETPLSKLFVWAHYHHGGDMSAAAKALRRDGWGDQSEPGPVLGLVGSDGSLALAPDPQSEPQADGGVVPISLTDRGNGDLLAHAKHDVLRWVPARGQWIVWDGCRWAWSDDSGPAIEAAGQVVDALDRTTKERLTHWSRSQSRRALESAVKLASANPVMRVDLPSLDADPWILNTPDGIVDLHTGQVSECTPEALCTRATRCGVDMDAPTPMWDQFLHEAMGGDEELIGYLQRLVGISAIGETRAHVMPFIFGPGANGKSVFLDVVMDVLGDYASSAPPGFLMAGRQDESAIARLAGLRFVACSEVGIRDRFDEAKVKLLTGGDLLTARHLYGRHFTFAPSHTLWLAGNHQPRVEAGGESFWRRTRMIGFTHTVPPQQRVDGLAGQLVAREGPGILGWIVRGAVASLSGLDEPASVTEATARYATEEDALARFMSDRVHLGGGDMVRVSTAEVRQAYQRWCRDEGEEELSAQIFGRELRSRWGITSVRSHGGRFYVGMSLLADADDEADQRQWSL